MIAASIVPAIDTAPGTVLGAVLCVLCLTTFAAWVQCLRRPREDPNAIKNVQEHLLLGFFGVAGLVLGSAETFALIACHFFR